MKKYSFIFVLFCMVTLVNNTKAGNGEPITNVATSAEATTSKVSGKIIDTKTGEGLPGALVQLNGNTVKAYTDLDGNFTIEKLIPGQYDIIVSYISYETHTVQNVQLKSGAGEDLTIEINPKQ